MSLKERLELFNHTMLFLVVLIVLVITIPFASGIDLGGSIGIDITIGENNDSDDDNDDSNSDEENEIGMIIDGFVLITDKGVKKRDDRYAFTGEEIIIDVRVDENNDDENNNKDLEYVMMTVGDEEVDCGKREGKYRCLFTVRESMSGKERISVKAFDEDDHILAKKKQEWEINPELTVEITDSSQGKNIENKEEIVIEIVQSCQDLISVEIDPEDDENIELFQCEERNFIIASVV